MPTPSIIGTAIPGVDLPNRGQLGISQVTNLGGTPPAQNPATPGNLQPATSTLGQGPYGNVPQVPSPTATQGATISGNMGNLGALYGLTGSLNTQIAGQAALPYQLNLPNYGALTNTASGNILSNLQGQIAPDVLSQIQTAAAERGVSTGSIGSPNANAALLAALGTNSQQLQGLGQTQLSAAMARTPTGQQFNPQSFLTTPTQTQEAQYASNVLGASPDPAAAAGAGIAAGGAGLNFGALASGGMGVPSLRFPNAAPTTATTPSNPVTASLSSLIPGLPSNSPNANPFQPGDFEAMGFFDDQSQLNPQTTVGDQYGTQNPFGDLEPFL
jgi:hypothetical protein